MPIASKPSSSAPLARRLANLEALLAKIGPVPDAWLLAPPNAINGHIEASDLGLIECSSYSELINAWRKAMHWRHGNDLAMSCMLASSVSTTAVGEQLWIKIIGPPSSGKTTMAEGLAVNTNYVVCKDTLKGFFSGYKEGAEDSEDKSLINKLRNMTLITMDGDTLLKLPNKDEILSQGRRIYDGNFSTDFKNGMGSDYDNLRMTWLMLGTSRLRAIDDSELGQRYIDCVVMEGIDDEHEDIVAIRAAYQEWDNSVLKVSEEEDGVKYSPELQLARQMTGGYLEYLHKNWEELAAQVTAEEEDLIKIAKLGKFTAFMRARPSKIPGEDGREFCPRLVKQLTKLPRFLAVVLNQRIISAEVMSRTTEIAMHTSRGISLNMVKLLAKNEMGLSRQSFRLNLNYPDVEIGKMLTFLKNIDVLELNSTPTKLRGMKTTQHLYRLTERFSNLYREVTT